MKYNNKIPPVKNIGFGSNFHERNQIGLDNAYSSNNKTYIDGNTAYIAGTDNWKDVFNDWVKIPLGLTRYSQRYKDADEILKSNPQVTKLTGNSLGGVVSLELQQNHPDRDYNVTTYAAPVVQFSNDKHMRFRHPNDPISMFDSGAITTGKGGFNILQNHDYSGYDQY